jgi:hypothetical protein
MPEIKYTSQVTALGRNGHSKQVGLNLIRYHYTNPSLSSVVQLSPINTKGGVTQCYLEVPMNDIPELIKQLEGLISIRQY